MSEIAIMGGGIAGLCGAMLLARDGHHVTVLERDPRRPTEPGDAWSEWERPGVNQFRLAHAFLPRFRVALDAELPGVVDGLVADGALRVNRIDQLPAQISGGRRPGDERFDQVTGRRPMVEASLARMAVAEPGVDIRRGVSVKGLLVAEPSRATVPHVAGVVTSDGDRLHADLVVDAGGRRSSLPDLLEAAGVRRPGDDVDDSGFIYYARHFRSEDGRMPAMMGPPLQHYDSISTATLVADRGHWSFVLVAHAKDALMRRARHVDVWDRVTRSYPLVAHWFDAEPVTGIDVMARIADRRRHFDVDGEPIATGLVAVGDAWACTSPSLGRGASTAALHSVCLRDAVRKAGTDDARALIRCWNETTDAVVTPLVEDTLAVDRHRLAQIEAQMCGATYEANDPGWTFAQALTAFSSRDPDLVRAAMDVGGMLERGVTVAARPGIVDTLRALGEVTTPPGPDRAELEAIVAG